MIQRCWGSLLRTCGPMQLVYNWYTITACSTREWTKILLLVGRGVVTMPLVKGRLVNSIIFGMISIGIFSMRSKLPFVKWFNSFTFLSGSRLALCCFVKRRSSSPKSTQQVWLQSFIAFRLERFTIASQNSKASITDEWVDLNQLTIISWYHHCNVSMHVMCWSSEHMLHNSIFS